MNVFFTDSSPSISAQNLDDKRVVKMILESAQMLAVAMAINGALHDELPINKDGKRYSVTGWRNHGCTIWASKTSGNYRWLLNHLKALCEEYSHRYGKTHFVESQIYLLEQGVKHVPVDEMTIPYNATIYKDIVFDTFVDALETYRKYMNHKYSNTDKRPPKWTSRQKPSWVS